MLALFESDITVLLALSFYQILVSDSLPASSESVPVVGQSAVLIRCGFITVVTITSCCSIGSHRPHRECPLRMMLSMLSMSQSCPWVHFVCHQLTGPSGSGKIWTKTDATQYN